MHYLRYSLPVIWTFGNVCSGLRALQLTSDQQITNSSGKRECDLYNQEDMSVYFTWRSV